jgi:hypothetical protein
MTGETRARAVGDAEMRLTARQVYAKTRIALRLIKTFYCASDYKYFFSNILTSRQS